MRLPARRKKKVTESNLRNPVSQHAAQKVYETAAVFPNRITSDGDFMQRPGMLVLLSFPDAQPGESFVVIFDDLNRFARDTRFHLDLRDAFQRRGATIECLNFKFDGTPKGEFIETIVAAPRAHWSANRMTVRWRKK